jgi:hypothetical protein
MNVLKAFLYGALVISAIVIFGIIGWGFSVFMAILSNAIFGILIVFGIVVVLWTVLAPEKSSEKTN